jgi:fucokinase
MTFDAVVVTSPDDTAAKAAQNGPLQQISSATFISTHDPYNTRCGSGGGTLAAMMLCPPEQTVLIVHAGGESSRCPTQMVLGKSWTTLATSTNRQVQLTNPTFLIVQKLTYLLRGIPRGSLVVAASDTLLHLPVTNDTYDWNSYPNAVIGLAVPAPLETAKNHGVYVLDDHQKTESIEPVRYFLQKPSVANMHQNAATFDHHGEACAWIDTGVVIFLPTAARALRELATHQLACCTWQGLERLWDEQAIQVGKSLEDFATDHVVKVELYTHLLMALTTKDSTNTLEDYLNRHSDLSTDILKSIHGALSLFPLLTLVNPSGRFLHLGTSRELVYFLTQGSAETGKDERCQSMGQELHLSTYYQSLITPTPSLENIVCYNSLIQTFGANLFIGDGSVLEHVHVTASVNISIGRECLVSGWRGEYTQNSIHLPHRTCLQVMPLLQDDLYVVMMFGLHDDIKLWDKVHGINADTFLEGTGLEDLWEPNEKAILWTARLHPVVEAVDIPRLFDWIQSLQQTGHVPESQIEYYKSCRRLSFQQIRRLSNAEKEWAFRYDLERLVIPVHLKLWNRLHSECDVSAASTSRVLDTLSEISWKAVLTEQYDICGRALMVGSASLADKSSATLAGELSVEAEALFRQLRNDDGKIDACRNIFKFCFTSLAEGHLLLERAASFMTEICVCGVSLPSMPRENKPALVDTWVIAAAPARIDLAGGWSDTAPICYEYGGSVCNVAVTVDGMKAISARSRIISGGSGIHLCTETREAKTGALLGHVETRLSTVGDLDDYQSPLAACALLKCALIYLGIRPDKTAASQDLQTLLQTFCRIEERIGMEIVTTSLLPLGSGMGTSSILAGCVLASVARLLGMNLSEEDESHLIQSVLCLEQLMSCGGGWQDQVGGLVGGAKFTCSEPNVIPVTTYVERISLDGCTTKELNDRLILVFTGKTRLAKNILQNVLRRWARRTDEITYTVSQLVEGAIAATKALQEGDVDTLAACLNRYWAQKKIMAGEQSGVEPGIVHLVLSELLSRKEIAGGSLCGAGGGGFMVLIASPGRTLQTIREACAEIEPAAKSFTWHETRVSEKGLRVTLCCGASEAFDLDWHK